MPTLMSIDPGAHSIAWAVFSDSYLVLVGKHSGCRSRLAVHCRNVVTLAPEDMEAVIEVPRIYPQRRWRGDPNDLIQVAIMVGVVASAFEASGKRVTLVEPHAWKGNRPKDVSQATIVASLNEAEQHALERLNTKAERKDALDAVGIGLWKLRRIG